MAATERGNPQGPNSVVAKNPRKRAREIENLIVSEYSESERQNEKIIKIQGFYILVPDEGIWNFPSSSHQEL